MICDPLTMYMMGAPADSGAAAVVCSRDKAREYGASKPITIAGICDVTCEFTDYDAGNVRLGRRASAKKVYELSGIGPEDVDFATVHDATAAHELHCYEDFQFCKEGESVYMVEEGKFEMTGDLPTNTDGGFLARGNGPGADALAFAAEAVWQLRGDAGQRQVPNAKVGMVFGLGLGAPPIGGAIILKG
jgi:acetyl-CoA acetyltransferase